MPIIEEAILDLAARLRVDASQIELVRIETVTWDDGSRGCPEEGKVYTQALVNGYQVVLSHGDRIFLYHAGEDGAFFLCPSAEKDGGYGFVPPPRLDD